MSRHISPMGFMFSMFFNPSNKYLIKLKCNWKCGRRGKSREEWEGEERAREETKMENKR
jgi:hypothetical protein